MGIAIGLLVLLAFTVIFHFVSPWWFTPLASNWGAMDDTIVLTFWVTGLVFIAISAFMIYCVVRYRHTEDRQAAYEPEHKKLEIWLMGLTGVGVVILLAPGLKVWDDYINVPENASVVEALAQQWQWSYRYPGADQQLGTAHVKYVSFENPAGVNPDDPHGQDDIVIVGSALHLPIDQPVKVLLRSKDVLHDFYVPQFRAKMDVVPGLVSYLWFTPTKLGIYEVVCAELCGVGHYKMRSHVVVESLAEYKIWLAQQPTFAESQQLKVAIDPLVQKGHEVAQNNGCLGCHSLDGGSMIGPTWKDMFGKTEQLQDGSSVLVDDNYIIESMVAPNAKIVKGYPAVMPATELSKQDLKALLAFMRSGAAVVDDNSDTDQQAKPQASDTHEGATTKAKNLVDMGRQLAQQKGCIACHSIDGSQMVGPSWLGLYGSSRELADGSTVIADHSYLQLAMQQPNQQVVKGFPAIMPPAGLSDAEVDAVIAYIKDGID